MKRVMGLEIISLADPIPEAKKPPRRQCAKCPWKKGVDPNEIPNGYDVAKHRALKRTIAAPASLSTLASGSFPIMACHESKTGAELPCVGWLANQLGDGQNLGLRLRVIQGQIDGNIETVGPQHERFEQTLPKAPKKARRKR